MSTTDDTLTTQLQLSLIYRRLLIDVLAIYNVEHDLNRDQQAVQLINDAFGEAVGHLSSWCEKCDSSNVVTRCADCAENKWSLRP